MKRVISSDYVFGMANLNPKKSGLNVIIWADHAGVARNKSDHIPRVKIGTSEASVSVSIEAEPQILAPKDWRSIFKQSEIRDILEGISYVKRNYDIFLRHYNDTTFEFDDEDLYQALRDRGEYR